jgi:hypothetical protein
MGRPSGAWRRFGIRNKHRVSTGLRNRGARLRAGERFDLGGPGLPPPLSSTTGGRGPATWRGALGGGGRGPHSRGCGGGLASGPHTPRRPPHAGELLGVIWRGPAARLAARRPSLRGRGGLKLWRPRAWRPALPPFGGFFLKAQATAGPPWAVWRWVGRSVPSLGRAFLPGVQGPGIFRKRPNHRPKGTQREMRECGKEVGK